MTAARPRLDELAARYALPDGSADRLDRLLGLVATDPTAPTTVTAPAEAVDVHVADSLAGLELEVIRGAGRIADLGAGAGFPGLPLAVALPAAHVDLVESAGRKGAFIAAAIEATDVPNAAVVTARAEEVDAPPYDVVTARALASLAVLVEYAAPLLREGGALVAWKGVRDEDEERAGAAAAEVVGLRATEVVAVSPFRAADHRHLNVYLKVAGTPARFPRRPGMARKRPLA